MQILCNLCINLNILYHSMFGSICCSGQGKLNRLSNCELEEFLGHKRSSTCQELLFKKQKNEYRRRRVRRGVPIYNQGGHSVDLKGGAYPVWGGAEYHYNRNGYGWSGNMGVSTPLYPNTFSDITTSGGLGYKWQNGISVSGSGYRTWGSGEYGLQMSLGITLSF